MAISRKALIITGLISLAGIGLGIYVYIKKKNNEGWKLLQLPFGNKKNRRIILN